MYHNFIVCLTWILHFNMCEQRAMNALVIKKFTIENFAGALFLYAFYHVWVIYFFVPQNMSTRTRQIRRQSSENQILFVLKVIFSWRTKNPFTFILEYFKIYNIFIWFDLPGRQRFKNLQVLQLVNSSKIININVTDVVFV